MELMSVLSRAGMYHFLGSYIGRSDGPAASNDIQERNSRAFLMCISMYYVNETLELSK